MIEKYFYSYKKCIECWSVSKGRMANHAINCNLLISYTHGPGIDEPVAMTTNGNLTHEDSILSISLKSQ